MLIWMTLFWVASLAILYTYMIYPLWVMVMARVAPRQPVAVRSSRAAVNVGVVIAAYNEEKWIRARIENILQQNYPQQKISIYIGSDGSSDATAEIVRSFQRDNIHFFDFKERRGKASVLNDLVARAQEDYLIFTDANTIFESDAIEKLISHFADDSVGAVVGELVLHPGADSKNQDGLYWRYEQAIKNAESKLGVLLGANGGIYAIRRAYYEPLLPDTIIDDFIICMRIAVARKTVVYDRAARAYEEIPETIEAEYSRRVRIGAGNFQAMMRLGNVFDGGMALGWAYISHKILRWFVPHCLLLVFVTSLLLAGESIFYALCFCAQLFAYSMSLVVRYYFYKQPLPKLIALIYFFVSMNFAIGHGFVRWLKGSQRATWQVAKR